MRIGGKKKWVRALMATTLLAATLASARAQTREQIPLDSGWRMEIGDPVGAQRGDYDDSGWASVTLPRAMNEDDAFRKGMADQKTGIVWYRKRLVLPRDTGPAAGGRAIIEFEGARQAADIFINGVRAGVHENGVGGFAVDATDHFKPAPFENVIAVRVDSSWDYKERATGTPFQWNNMNFNANYGGINQPVRLHLTGSLHQTLPFYSSLGTTGVYIWADAINLDQRSARIHAESQVRNDSDIARTFRYRVTLRDVDGMPAGSFESGPITLAAGETRAVSAESTVGDLHFWSWGYGYLYTVSTALVEDGRTVDETVTRTGFRKTEFRDGMILLNDRVIQVHGYAQRSTNEWPALGSDVPVWMSDLSNRLIVDSGGNLVRWMHVAPPRQEIESADRVGLLQAMPAGDAESDVEGRRWEQRVELMRDTIIATRNNPSVLFYEGGNEDISEAHMAELKALRDKYDPHGGRAIGSREMLDSKVAEYGGEMLYINKSAGKPLWAMEYSRDEGARKFQDNYTPPYHVDSPDYNRNQDSQAVESVRRWYDYWRVRPGTGTRVSAGGVNIGWTDSNSHFRGDNNYRRSGEVDAMRLPKESFFAHQVMWDGWVDVERPRTHLVGHWNYKPGTTKDIFVVSSADRVELRLNGKAIGDGKRSDRFLFTFPDVSWASGTLEAIGFDAKGREVSRDTRVTTGAPAALRLTSITGPGGWRADGSDIALVDVEVVDAEGRRVPIANDKIHFNLAGPAEWRGGIAQGDSTGRTVEAAATGGDVNIVTQAAPVDGVTHYQGTARHQDNYILSRELPVEGGINRIALRSTKTAGKIELVASAPGLQPARLRIDSLDQSTGGLQPIGGDRLPVSLVRGPTPPTPSYQVTRIALQPTRTLAGSNADSTLLARDDDETTHWASDGRPGTAWIEWQLAAPQRVDQLELKLIGWRIRAYPLRVTVDGATVYEGTPQKTLGYTVLPLKPRTGSKIRLELTGPTEDRDAFGNIVEITGARAGLDTGAELVPAGNALGIVEAEIYRKVSPATPAE